MSFVVDVEDFCVYCIPGNLLYGCLCIMCRLVVGPMAGCMLRTGAVLRSGRILAGEHSSFLNDRNLDNLCIE